ncbi:hypothetical protein MANI_025544 [Metarhizium anisopliae]|nr:hypothetical protein MANI_025544 [Metarhizium anisopliae]
MSKALQITSVGWLLISLGHTVPLINYAWSKNPALLRDPVQKAVAGAMIAIMWASGWWYAKNGVTSNAVAVGAIGALQGYSAFTI